MQSIPSVDLAAPDSIVAEQVHLACSTHGFFHGVLFHLPLSTEKSVPNTLGLYHIASVYFLIALNAAVPNQHLRKLQRFQCCSDVAEKGF